MRRRPGCQWYKILRNVSLSPVGALDKLSCEKGSSAAGCCLLVKGLGILGPAPEAEMPSLGPAILPISGSLLVGSRKRLSMLELLIAFAS